MYGFKMTESLSIATGTTNSSGYTIVGRKAFKYISAIANASTPTSTSVSIGLTDRYGFPLYVPYCGQNIDVRLMTTSFSSVTTGVAFSSANTILGTTATQTSTTPDVRGTYSSSTASNGTVRLQMTVTLAASGAATITSTNVTAMFGQTQFSSV